MDNLTEKLNTFTSLVLKDASDKREQILKSVEREHKERLTEKENEFLEEAYEEIQQAVSDAKKYSNEKVLHEELDAKKQLLLAREKIISEVMEAATAKLKQFIAGDKYEAWLIGKIEKALFEVGKGAKTVYISSNDLQYKEKIEQLDMTKITVEAAEDRDFLGGAKIYNTDRKIAVDYSFKEMLSEQKSIFLQSSGLTLS
ncbi:MAG: V-type ATP synthase subunit E [Clostridia bacterium]